MSRDPISPDTTVTVNAEGKWHTSEKCAGSKSVDGWDQAEMSAREAVTGTEPPCQICVTANDLEALNVAVPEWWQ